jgi:hypothetical protein
VTSRRYQTDPHFKEHVRPTTAHALATLCRLAQHTHVEEHLSRVVHPALQYL